MTRLAVLTIVIVRILCPSSAWAQAWSGVLSTSRAIDWSGAGVPGGIPTRTMSCANLTSSATAAEITAAVWACPSGQVVNLAAGTYMLDDGIWFDDVSGVTLRGAGANQTFLVFSSYTSCHGIFAVICLDSDDTNYNGSPSNSASWTAGYVRGDTSITISSKTNLAVGDPLTLDQLDDSSDGGVLYVCSVDPCATAGNGGSPRTGRTQQQIVTVTSISGGACPCTIGITPGLYMPNWAGAKTPQAWWPTTPISLSGIENLSADYRTLFSTGAGFAIFNCNGCWLKGVRGVMATRAHVRVYQSNRVTIRDSYFYENVDHGTTSYGIETFPGSDILVENNIFQAVTAPIVMSGSCVGCVFAYNFDVNNRYTTSDAWQSHEGFAHAGGTDFVLFEGNSGVGIYSDTFHGTHHFMTIFRNRYHGFMPNGGTTTTGNTIPMRLDAFSRFYNVVGNVLGSTSRPHTSYADVGDQSVFLLGSSNGATAGFDALTGSTLFRWGNWDVVTNATRWCGNSGSTGWATTCSSTSEVPTGLSLYANTVPATETLPDSMYLSGRPSWWSKSIHWPPIGPDVTGGDVASVSRHANKIPAQRCYERMGGSADGVGAVLTFKPDECYTANAFRRPIIIRR